jgi:uncharacterized protein YxjI
MFGRNKEEPPPRNAYRMREQMLSIGDDFWIENGADGRKWEIMGKIADHNYKIETHDGAPIAEVGKRWFRVRDSYGVAVAPNQDDAFVLAVAIVIDQVSHPHT